MLITFTCDAYENVTLFGDIAMQFLIMMGQRGVVPGAMLASEVSQALLQLKEAVKKAEPTTLKPSSWDNEDEEPVVSLSHRALPLIKLLTAAEKAEVAVMWT